VWVTLGKHDGVVVGVNPEGLTEPVVVIKRGTVTGTKKISLSADTPAVWLYLDPYRGLDKNWEVASFRVTGEEAKYSVVSFELGEGS
jgi:hypothetical protein